MDRASPFFPGYISNVLKKEPKSLFLAGNELANLGLK
jgi:hypothetical protein